MNFDSILTKGHSIFKTFYEKDIAIFIFHFVTFLKR